jgi:molecular chaperone DnaK (HSP70)
VDGTPEIRSVVYQEEKGNIVVGKAAYDKYLVDPENGVLEIKREMGNESHRVLLRGKPYTPAEISSMILGKIRDEIYGKFPAGQFSFGGVVVTHPFHFKQPQIEDTRRAAEMTGMNIIGLVPEPVAAAMAYTLHYFKDHLEPDKPETILVFDLGGGTFDTSLFELKETGDRLVFRGLSTGGDARLGGMDFNRSLMKYALRKEGLELAALTDVNGLRARVRFEHAIEAVKRDLAVLEQSFLGVSDILPGKHINRDFTREELEKVLRGEEGDRNYYDDMKMIIRETCHKGRNPKVDKVLLVGGSTRIPFIRDRRLDNGKTIPGLIHEELPDAQIYANLSESLAVAMGAAIFAASKDRRFHYDKEIEITPPGYAHDFGIRDKSGRFISIINNNAPMPASGSKVFISPEDNTALLSFEVYEREGGWPGDSIEEGLKEGRIFRLGKIPIDGLPSHRKGEIEAVVGFTVAGSDQVGVHIEVFHNKSKIKEIDSDIRRTPGNVDTEQR